MALRTKLTVLLFSIVALFVGYFVMANVFYKAGTAILEFQNGIAVASGDWNKLLGTTKSLYLSAAPLAGLREGWLMLQDRCREDIKNLERSILEIDATDDELVSSVKGLTQGMLPGLSMMQELDGQLELFLATETGKHAGEMNESLLEVFLYRASTSQVDELWINLQRIKGIIRVIDVFGAGYYESQQRLTGRITERANSLRSRYLYTQVFLGAVILLVLSVFLYQIGRLNATLKLAVDSQTKELANKLAELRRTQDVLIESRRQIWITNAVVGLSHEINTPLGVAMTTQSALGAWLFDIEDQYRTNTLGRNSLEMFFRKLRESNDLTERNLGKVSSMLGYFRKLSVDLEEYVEELIEIRSWFAIFFEQLSAHVLRQGLTLNWSFEGENIVRTSPGAIAVVINQLVENSVAHAFDPGAEGAIQIAFRVCSRELEIACSDDGKGIDAALRDQVFEPFVTSKRAEGRMGLGLSIVQNIVTQRLHGSIEITDSARGATFTIRIPQ